MLLIVLGQMFPQYYYLLKHLIALENLIVMQHIQLEYNYLLINPHFGQYMLALAQDYKVIDEFVKVPLDHLLEHYFHKGLYHLQDIFLDVHSMKLYLLYDLEKYQVPTVDIKMQNFVVNCFLGNQVILVFHFLQ